MLQNVEKFWKRWKNLWVPTQKHDFQALKWWPDAVGIACLVYVLCQFGTVLQETIYGHIVKIKFEDRAKTYLPTVFFSRKGNYDYNIQSEISIARCLQSTNTSRDLMCDARTVLLESCDSKDFQTFRSLKKNLICHLNKTMRLCIIQARIFVFSRKILLSSESSKKSVMLMLQHLLHGY